MQQLTECLGRDERGAAVMEYALLVGLLAVTCLGALSLMGQEISTFLSNFATALSTI
jgi:Flp pilus assembly pilin Flp